MATWHEQGLQWCFDVIGTVEAPSVTDLGLYTCKARETIERTIPIHLPGAPPLPAPAPLPPHAARRAAVGAAPGLQVDVEYPPELDSILRKCTTVELGPVTPAPDGCLLPTILLDFAPLRPLQADLQARA